MSKASVSLLEQIHELLAKKMLEMLEEGTAGAKEWAVIVKFLKDNSIDAIPSDATDADDALTKLMQRAQDSIAQYQ